MSVKTFLQNWVIPPAVLAKYHASKQPKLKKFWRGSVLPANQFEADFFLKQGLHANTITRGDDSRQAARVDQHTRIALSLKPGNNAIQFAITPISQWPPGAKVEIACEGKRNVRYGLDAAHWLDIRCDVAASAVTLDIKCDAPIYVSFPTALNTQPNQILKKNTAPRHVLVMVLDGCTTRWFDAIQPQATAADIMPNSMAFFASGYQAWHGYASGEWTMPTVASFFTGLYTSRHKMYHPTKNVSLSPQQILLAEYLQAAGYHTLALSTANRVTPAYGYHRGFDRFIYHWPHAGHTQKDYDPAVWIHTVLGHLVSHQFDKTFTYVHFPDTHPAWDIGPMTRSFNLARRGETHPLQSEAHLKAHGRTLFIARLQELDRALVALFEYIRTHIDEETLVVLTSDHGTPWKHCRAVRPQDEPYLVDDRTAIPMLMRGPNVPQVTYPGLVAPNIDLMPTILNQCNIALRHPVEGQNLLDSNYHRDYIVSESIYNEIYEIAVRDAARCYIEKYPFSSDFNCIASTPTYQRLFAQGVDHYADPLNEETAFFEKMIEAHVQAGGLL